MNPTLLTKADEIALMICSSDAAHTFWQAREKMARNEEAQALFESLKLKTNHRLGMVQTLPEDHPRVQQLDQEIHQIEEQLESIPVAIQYKNSQDELNDIMQSIVGRLLSRLSEEMPVELGPRVGCGKGPDGNGCNCGGSH